MNSTIELISLAAMVIAITGVVLNNHGRRACFWVWLASNTISAMIHIHSGLVVMTVGDIIFAALAVHGLVCWSKKESNHG